MNLDWGQAEWYITENLGSLLVERARASGSSSRDGAPGRCSHVHEVIEVLGVVEDGLCLARDGQDSAHCQQRELACAAAAISTEVH